MQFSAKDCFAEWGGQSWAREEELWNGIEAECCHRAPALMPLQTELDFSSKEVLSKYLKNVILKRSQVIVLASTLMYLEVLSQLKKDARIVLGRMSTMAGLGRNGC